LTGEPEVRYAPRFDDRFTWVRPPIPVPFVTADQVSQRIGCRRTLPFNPQWCGCGGM